MDRTDKAGLARLLGSPDVQEEVFATLFGPEAPRDRRGAAEPLLAWHAEGDRVQASLDDLAKKC